MDKLQLELYSKNLIYNSQYQCVCSKENIKLYKIQQNQKIFKYSLNLRINSQIGWLTKSNNLKVNLIGFYINANKKIKRFYSDNEQELIKLKELIACKISFHSIYDVYELKEEIGTGSSCRVVRGFDKHNQKDCAIKILEKSNLRPINFASMELEIEILVRLKGIHNFVQIYEVYQSQFSYFIVMQLLSGQSLSKYLESLKKSRLPLKSVNLIMKKLLESVTILHQHKIIHRDLKPDNIILAEKDNFESITIIDFGLATFSQLDRFLLYRCGTPGYVAPEILMNQSNAIYAENCDAFSCGCIFYKILTGRSAFRGISFEDLVTRNKQCEIDFNLRKDDYITSESIKLLKGLLQKNPSDRFSTKIALQSSFFYNESYFSVNDEDWDQAQLVPQLPTLQISNGKIIKDFASFKSPKFFENLSNIQIKYPQKHGYFLSPQVSPSRKFD